MATITDIEAARTTAQTAGEALGELTAGGYTIGDELKKRVQEALDYNKDLTEPLDVRTASYVSAPSTARAKYADPTSQYFLKSPVAQRAAVSQYTGAKSIPMLATAGALGQRFGSVADIIGRGTNAYQAQTARAQSKYDIARQNVADLLTQYAAEQPTTAQITANGRELLVTYDREGNIINTQDVGAAKSAGGGGGAADIMAAMAALGILPGVTETPSGKRDLSGLDAAVETEEVNINPPNDMFTMVDPITGARYPDTKKQEDFFSRYGGINLGGLIQPSGVIGPSGVRY